MRKTSFPILLAGLMAFVPLAAFAATVTVSDDTTLVLPSDSSEYTLASGSTFEELTVDGSTITFSMNGGESITITSATKRTLANNASFTPTCGSSQSSLTITLPSSAPIQPIVITPGGTCSTGGGGGSPVIGQTTPTPSSGGGGGSPPPPPPPPPAPAPTPTPAKPATPSAAKTPTPGSSASLPPVATLVQSVFFKNLAPGNRGNEVRQLQELLRRDKTLYPEGIVNGTYGPATTRAVRRFQKKYGISQTGTLGPLTRAKLMSMSGTANPTPAPAPTPAQTPAVPSTVQTLQAQLAQLLQRIQELRNATTTASASTTAIAPPTSSATSTATTTTRMP